MQTLPRHPNYDSEPSYEPVRWRVWLAFASVFSAAMVFAVYGLIRDSWSDAPWSDAPLPDVSQPSYLTLSYSERDVPSGLSIHITGEIDGVAEVWAENWKTQRLSGRVDWKVYHDWFSPNCTLNYRPVGRVSGQLVVRYKFH